MTDDTAGTVIGHREDRTWSVQAGHGPLWTDVSPESKDRASQVSLLLWRREVAQPGVVFRLVRNDTAATRTVEIASDRDYPPYPPPLTGDDALAILRTVWNWIEDANNGHGADIGDLMDALVANGYGPDHIEGH